MRLHRRDALSWDGNPGYFYISRTSYSRSIVVRGSGKGIFYVYFLHVRYQQLKNIVKSYCISGTHTHTRAHIPTHTKGIFYVNFFYMHVIGYLQCYGCQIYLCIYVNGHILLLVGWSVGLYDISTFVGFLTPNLFLCK